MTIIFARNNNQKLIFKGAAIIAFFFFSISASMAEPKEAKFSEVESCQFLGKVEGSSGYGKNYGWQPLAKYSALHRAEKLGASHIVMEQMIPIGAFNGIMVASAYSCSS
jgi:hypothetical protein